MLYWIIFGIEGRDNNNLYHYLTKKFHCVQNAAWAFKNHIDLTEAIINLESVNPIEFFGVNNGKLDILKKKFPLLKVLSRGTQVKLSGSPEQVEGAKEKIDLIVQYLERNGHMSENYFEQILGGDDAEVVSASGWPLLRTFQKPFGKVLRTFFLTCCRWALRRKSTQKCGQTVIIRVRPKNRPAGSRRQFSSHWVRQRRMVTYCARLRLASCALRCQTVWRRCVWCLVSWVLSFAAWHYCWATGFRFS